MSFLAPIFLTGAALIALPILYHLIRQQVRDKQWFSSLMFLQPSPPQVKSRRRLDQILLLLLRCLALLLVALAFARPFQVTEKEVAGASAGPRRITVLLDRSASMRREDTWQRAREEVGRILDTLGPLDRGRVLVFDELVEPLMEEDEWGTLGTEGARTEIQARLTALEPSWRGTRLSTALESAWVLPDNGEQDEGLRPGQELFVVSDFQRSEPEEVFRRLTWPEDVTPIWRALVPSNRARASAHAVPPEPEDAASGSKRAIRVRRDEGTGELPLTAAWQGIGEDQTPKGETVAVTLPTGTGRLVQLPPPPDASLPWMARLSGDGEDWDNSVYFAPPAVRRAHILLTLPPNDEGTRLAFFAKAALNQNDAAEVQFIELSTAVLPTAEQESISEWWIGAGAPSTDLARRARAYLDRGGSILWLLTRDMPARSLDALLPSPMEWEEAPDARASRISGVQFDHPLLKPFADPRFSDFSKTHFWHHRMLKQGSFSPDQVLMRLDSDAPWLLQHRVGAGKLLVMTSTWHEKDSEFALSSKFVPLMIGMARQAGALRPAPRFFNVGETVTLDRVQEGTVTVEGPDGETTELEGDTPVFADTQVPGIYRVANAHPNQFAVNLDPLESRSESLDLDSLMPKAEEANVSPESEAGEDPVQAKVRELEASQQLWRWLILAAFVIALVETWMAGRPPAPAASSTQ